MCVQGVSGERVCVYISEAFSMALKVARIGYRVVFSVMEENVHQ